MLPLSDERVTILSLLLLLVISLVTVEVCRRDRLGEEKSEKSFLFKGKEQIHSLASNVGALFSLTYFFGGALAYGFLFGVWYLVGILVILALLVPTLWRMIDRLSDTAEGKPGNLLLDFVKRHLTQSDFQVILRLYSVVYFLLLVEELAVSRLVMTKLLPFHPSATTFALATICLVVYAYLVFGGFRAVLNSDAVQILIIGGFVACLLFLMIKNGASLTSSLVIDSASTSSSMSFTMIFMIIFGLSWFASGVDFFSRLNFSLDNRRSVKSQRKAFVLVSLLLTFLVLIVRVIFGVHLRSEISGISSTELYTAETIAYFFGLNRPAISVLFICSVFCMIFTTIDTIFLTLLQLGQYQSTPLLKRSGAAQLLLGAVVLSCFVTFDAVSALGIFVGSLMILPAVGVLKAFSLKSRLWIPSLRALEGALLLAAISFGVNFDRLKLAFEEHFLIPGGVIFSVVTCLCVMRLIELRRRKDVPS